MTTGTTMTASITHSIVNDGDGYFDHMGWHLWIWDAAGVMAFHSVFDTIAAAQAYATSAYGLTVADEFVEECGECEVAHDLLDLVSDGSAFPPPRMLAGAGAAAFDATIRAEDHAAPTDPVALHALRVIQAKDAVTAARVKVQREAEAVAAAEEALAELRARSVGRPRFAELDNEFRAHEEKARKSRTHLSAAEEALASAREHLKGLT